MCPLSWIWIFGNDVFFLSRRKHNQKLFLFYTSSFKLFGHFKHPLKKFNICNFCFQHHRRNTIQFFINMMNTVLSTTTCINRVSFFQICEVYYFTILVLISVDKKTPHKSTEKYKINIKTWLLYILKIIKFFELKII